ncbi:TPA: hypothetical protein HA361_01960 [Candidatus Woesearchaeota archaeon]|nr:hypothetical protein [Candidatus Woesearchaeota archaeon]HII68616.1 hypothetical protein [Candidatus Woesearchaeota archaeon]
MVEYLEGVLKLAGLVLSVLAAILAVTLLRHSLRKRELWAWIFLIIALVLFMVQEILGFLRAFSMFESTYLTHINVTVILVCTIIAVAYQFKIAKETI